MSKRTQLSMSAVQKSRKRGRDKGEDLISNVPESVISHILSLLPTKDAVRTCVLSKDWESKWTSVYNLDIDDRELLSEQRDVKTTFVNFLERILLPSPIIKSFRLLCGEKYDSTCMMAWICAVLSRNVECFELTYFHIGIILLWGFLNNTSLIKLKLELPCLFKVPPRICFPNLKSLDLHGVCIINEIPDTDTLTLTFPVLETFDALRCMWLNVKFVEIYAPALTTFTSGAPFNTDVDGYSIKILGAKVSGFKSHGGLPEKIDLDGSTVVTAALQNKGDMYDSQLLGKSGLQVRILLQGFSSLEALELSGWVVEAIAQSEHQLALPMYDKLKRLVLHSRTNTKGLLELLHSAPSLRTLVLDMSNLNGWVKDTLEYVPTCVISHLEEVELIHYIGSTPELGLAKLLLKNGFELRKFHVDTVYKMFKDGMIKGLSTSPKASTCLTVTVS